MLPAPPGVYVIRNASFEAWLLPLGARLMQLWWLGAPEGPRPLCVGFESPQDYRADNLSMGSVCGRYGNRIEDALLGVADQRYALDVNHPMGHCLHGGRVGFGKRVWRVRAHTPTALSFHLHSASGDQGFPGNCDASVSYALSNDGCLTWTATAQVDAPCPINLVPHPYWNLDGHADVTTHQLWVNAHTYLPLNARELPEPPASVADTPFDYTTARRIRRVDIPALDAAYLIHRAASADHGNGLHVAARCEAGGLRLTVSTDRPFVHLYAAAGLAPQSVAEANGHAKPLGVAHQPGAGLCLETEDWPNGPANQREEVWYDAHRAYSHKARWQFTTL